MSAATRRALPLALLALALLVAACSGPPPAGERGPTLTATLTTPTDIDLSWEAGAEVAGWVLEFATEEGGPYTPLQYLPPEVTTYRHPDLMPGTPFHYRLVTFRGPASESVDVALPDGELTEEDENADHTWLEPVTREGATVHGAPLSSPDAARPTDLAAEIKHANGIHFTWTDRAVDEEGFLLESRVEGGAPFYGPIALIDPDVNSYGLITLPEEKTASYRVRAFTHGPASNTVRVTTGGG
ncbi:fibronectin type III domain-containing protein [Streptomyces radicis]|uniref:Fibronectin type III domain-containing protein n=1 Tax=Streptomyces radicis TaxID=1750517 RepID=A0A3A9WA96_9ACTN|nr:fibronectin type III domain-containing protein [Streptomyces radicis]RKN06304.1 fibronectin type III domain-containing protein [Streptomyces radicis]RKN18634.1 fibronectin type III domain-containing protein [Streptomyces radicis]